MRKNWEKIRTAGLLCLLALAVCPAGAQRVAPYLRAAEEKEREGWQAYRLEEGEKGLRALADRVFMEGKRGADGSTYSSCHDIGPAGPLKPGQPIGFRCAQVAGEAGPGGSFRPRVIVLTHQLVEGLPGGGRRTRVWSAAQNFDMDGVRVDFKGTAYRSDGTTAPNLDGDPRDQDGWAKALDDMLGAWAPGAGQRAFFDPW